MSSTPTIIALDVDGSGHARALVEMVRDAARRHNLTWEALVPDRHTLNIAVEDAEEAAYVEMAEAKRALRRHICETYGISIRELSALSMP